MILNKNIFSKEKESNTGLMVLFTRDTEKMIWLMVKVGLFITMEMYMKGNGKMIKLMVLEPTCILMVHSTHDIIFTLLFLIIQNYYIISKIMLYSYEGEWKDDK